MNICLVTAFPPSRDALNEYGFHIARELQEIPGLTLTILGDDFAPVKPELDGFSVIRCWKFNRLSNPLRLLSAIRKVQPDVVWFNLGFASFGGRPVPAFVGIAIPAMVRLAGFYTHVTVHQLMETVDLKDAGVRLPILYKIAGFMATQLLLFANSISVLLPAYRTLIRDKYRRGSVYVRKHGILSGRPEYPDFAKRGNPRHRILAFGKWGTYKRLEPMIDAFDAVARQVPNVELVIAGTDHPKAQGYLASVQQRCKDRPNITFAGYVPEEQIGELFQSVTVAVMPYTSSAGSSGVAHLACAYGVPIVASNIPDFRQLVEEEGLAIDLYQPGNLQSLAEQLVDLLESRERQMEMATQNFSAALRMSMPEVIRQYLRTFNLQQELGLLSSIARLRKVPRWFPLRARLVRAAARRRLARLTAAAVPGSMLGLNLVDGEHDRRGTMLHSSIPGDGNNKRTGRTTDPPKIGGRRGASAGTQQAQHNDQNARSEQSTYAFPSVPARPTNGNGHHPKAGEQETVPGLLPFPMRPHGNGAGRDGQNGTGAGASGTDGRGAKGATDPSGKVGASEADGSVD